MSIWDDIVAVVQAAGGQGGTTQQAQAAASGGSAVSAVGGALSNAGSAAEALTAFFAYLTNVAMWRSLGWLLLGVALMILGLALFLKGEVSPGAAAALAGLLWPPRR